MAAYQLASTGVIRAADGAMIPADPANRDYAVYLAWVAAGGAATPCAPPSHPTTISASEFLERFTPSEQAAVQQACITNAQIALGLTLGLAKGTITLTSPVLTQWLAALVAVGALTPARSTEVSTI